MSLPQFIFLQIKGHYVVKKKYIYFYKGLIFLLQNAKTGTVLERNGLILTHIMVCDAELWVSNGVLHCSKHPQNPQLSTHYSKLMSTFK